VNAERLASELKNFLLDSYEQIAAMKMDSNCKGSMLWFWSPSSKPSLPSFKNLYGISGAVVAGLDFMHGLAMAADMYFEIIPGATGYIDTNYSAKADATIQLFKKYDFVLTHVNATDEAAHMHDPGEKIKAIENIDRKILEPVFCHLKERYARDFSVVVCGDHKTRCSDGKHVGDPVPFVCYRDASDTRFQKKWTGISLGESYQSLNFISRFINHHS
jgi:2,3-bisphosphoglycerate-independent phosphoglycerate mutase